MDPFDFLSALQGLGQAGLPPVIKLATIDPAYTGYTGYPDIPLPKVTFDGETTLSTKQYTVLGDYIPVAGDRVLMVPVGRTYVIVGVVRRNATVVRPDAEYNNVAVQSIPNVADTLIAFDTDTATCPLVTKATDTPGHKFTLGRAGVWAFTTSTRWVGGTVGERYTAITLDGNPCASGTGGPANSPASTNIAVTRRCNAGQVIRVSVFHNDGGALNTAPNASLGWMRLNLAWLGP